MKRLLRNFILLLLIGGIFVAISPTVEAGSRLSQRGLTNFNFEMLAEGGFGDSANSYAWSVAYFKGDLYVGTNRHHLWAILQGFDAQDVVDLPIDIPLGIVPDGPKNETWGNPDWAKDMRGEIWRYKVKKGTWEMVHQAEILNGELPILGLQDQPVIGDYPESYGYRTLGTFNDYIYAIGIGPWVPPMPMARILRSPTGDPGSWEDVSGVIATATNPRGLIEYKGKLYISASLPGTYPAGAGQGVVYCSSDPGTKEWQMVSSPGFGSEDNAEIPYLTVFNGYLYGSTVNYNTGFEVWKTDGTALDDSGTYVWTQVVKDGFGDTYNQWGMTMQPFGDYLYVGTATGGGMVLKDFENIGTRAIDVIRIDKNDKAVLVVGAFRPSDPPPGWPEFRRPLSGIPAGFGNIFNVYTWHMAVHEDWLYLGTFDRGGLMADGVKAIISESLRPSALFSLGGREPDQRKTRPTMYSRAVGGADLWKTKDGIHWIPVTLNGFGNSYNVGIRRLLSVPDLGLIVTTANPMTGFPNGGCEVLLGYRDSEMNLLPGIFKGRNSN